MLPRHYLSGFEMVPVASVITSITLVFTYHMCCIFIVMFLFLNLHSFFLHAFQSAGIATSINMQVPLSLSHVMMSGLLPVCTVGSTIQLPYLQDLFRLISLHGHTGVCCYGRTVRLCWIDNYSTTHTHTYVYIYINIY